MRAGRSGREPAPLPSRHHARSYDETAWTPSIRRADGERLEQGQVRQQITDRQAARLELLAQRRQRAGIARALLVAATEPVVLQRQTGLGAVAVAQDGGQLLVAAEGVDLLVVETLHAGD